MICFIDFVYYKNYNCESEDYNFGQIIYYDSLGEKIDVHTFNLSYMEFLVIYDLFKSSNDMICTFSEYDLKK